MPEPPRSVSRRTLLAAGAFGALGTARPAAAASRPDIGVAAYAFPLTAVRLLGGPLAANAGRTHSYLSFLDPDRLLHAFRRNVGLASSATPCGGWESPSTELRGHSTGHLLSALSQAYASTGTAEFKSDYLVTELAGCQARATTAGFNAGYLSAFPESFIDRVEARRQVWAPYYTLHKIMAGLLDAHLLTGNAQALTVLLGMAAWVKLRCDRLSYTQRQNMLDTEFGGMNEVLTNLYQLTGDPAHLATAQYFDHAEVFDPARGRDRRPHLRHVRRAHPHLEQRGRRRRRPAHPADPGGRTGRRDGAGGQGRPDRPRRRVRHDEPRRPARARPRHDHGDLDAAALHGDGEHRPGDPAALPPDLGSTTGNWIGRSQYAGDPYLRGAVDSLRIYS
ncbi:beta-L-arabinofuranosidase domain-containing protein [Microbispora siamensis]|uniref:Non-reducing end beta-L-arabinofuranosidase-like GH127 catalytic domain-containing protein n=1 Tax=Microbispora siamensis TaxID=564413 RepID=A0ABQ4GEM4_9ACTN|nr:beta-L-arabinofuranosidase domain-containing protein [Microbispora siamensis]GIH59871.1 hypothetical protein Msi02_06880 [Microbispora siamensis]